MKTFATLTLTAASMFVAANSADAQNYSTPFYGDTPSTYSAPRNYAPAPNSYRPAYQTPVRPTSYSVPVSPAYGPAQPAYRYPSYVQPVNNQSYYGSTCPNGQCGPCANGQCSPHPATGCINGRCYNSGYTNPVRMPYPAPVYRPAVAPRYVPRTSYNTGGPVRVFRD